MAKTAQQIAAKYQRNVQAAAADYTAGVNNPKRDWATAYQAAQPRMIAGMQAAITSGKMMKGVQASGGSANWQQKTVAKGARNYVAAAADAAQGYQAVADKIISAGEQARQAANALPNATKADREQRAIAAMRAIAKAHGKA